MERPAASTRGGTHTRAPTMRLIAARSRTTAQAGGPERTLLRFECKLLFADRRHVAPYPQLGNRIKSLARHGALP